MEKKDEDKEFEKFINFDHEVEDLGCAAALSLAGFDPILITGKKIGEFAFIFQSTDKVKDMVASYQAGTLEVKARDFFAEVETLKSQVDDRGPGGIIYEAIAREEKS